MASKKHTQQLQDLLDEISQEIDLTDLAEEVEERERAEDPDTSELCEPPTGFFV